MFGDIRRVDLHGMSVDNSQNEVKQIVLESVKSSIKIIHIITGRGNHLGPDNVRGALYKKTPSWLNSDELRPHIWYVEKKLGSYKVFLIQKSSLKSQPILNPAIRIGDETELMKLVRLPETQQKKQQIEMILLETRGNALEQTTKNGTTALMVAASLGYIKTMDLLLAEEKDFFPPKLLKQKRADGFNVLMVASLCEQVKAVKYLLRKAPSLIKDKDQKDRSIFSVIEMIQNQSQIVDILYNHLLEHRREKGYTDLWRECKIIKDELRIKKPLSSDNTDKSKKVEIIESQELKKHKIQHSWFFNDRMLDFVTYLKNFKRAFQGVEKETAAFSQVDDSRKMRKIFKTLLIKNNEFRRLFLKYNNEKKESFRQSPPSFKPSAHLIIPTPVKRSRVQKPNGTITFNIYSIRKSLSEKNHRLSLVSSSRFQEVQAQKEKRSRSSYKLVIQGQDPNKPLIYTTTELVVVKDKAKPKTKTKKNSKKKKL